VTVRRCPGSLDDTGQGLAGEVACPDGLQGRLATPLRVSRPKQWPIGPDIVLRFGSAILASVLLGVPRALDARSFGAQRSAYIEMAPSSPELEAFAGELSRALAAAGFSMAARPGGPTLVVEVHALWRSRSAGGPASETISFTVRDRQGWRPLILHYAPEERPAAARALLRSLEDRTARES
jgi:hypothetical protein